MRVIVTGSRRWKFPAAELIVERLEKLPRTDLMIVHGKAEGADEIAHLWAKRRLVKVEVFPAQWGKHGPQAGIIRNQQMADSGADLLLAFPLENSRGTWDMIRRAKSAGIPIEVIRK